MKLAELMIAEARERGLRYFFGLPGGGSPLEMVEFGRQLGIRFVSVAHESSAAIMAAYYGLMSDTAGLALAIKGVGAGNLAGGAANAHFERAPVVCCCESAPTDVTHRDLVSLCPHEGLFGAVVKYYATLSPEEAAGCIQQAFFLATDGRPGPVLLDFPSDLGQSECAPGAAGSPSPDACQPDEQRIASARQLLQSARRPIVLAGSDVIRAGATRELRALVEEIGAAVLVSIDARGVFVESDPRWAGPFVGQFTPNISESEIIAKADVALIIGVDSLASDQPWNIDLPTCELVARPEYESLATRPTVRVDGDIRVALNRLLSGSSQEGFPKDEIQASREKILQHFKRPQKARLAVQDILEIMRTSMPSEGILFSETGAFILMLHQLWPVDRPGTHFCTAGGRTMGLMMPAIAGAKLAKPEVPMMGIGADGSTLMRLGELEVFARMGIAVPLVIVNDQALGTMKSRQKSRGMPDYALDFEPVDFAAIAKACGLRGVTVDTPLRFEEELKLAMAADQTTLIDARVDPQPYQDSFARTIGVLDD